MGGLAQGFSVFTNPVGDPFNDLLGGYFRTAKQDLNTVAFFIAALAVLNGFVA